MNVKFSLVTVFFRYKICFMYKKFVLLHPLSRVELPFVSLIRDSSLKYCIQTEVVQRDVCLAICGFHAVCGMTSCQGKDFPSFRPSFLRDGFPRILPGNIKRRCLRETSVRHGSFPRVLVAR